MPYSPMLRLRTRSSAEVVLGSAVVQGTMASEAIIKAQVTDTDVVLGVLAQPDTLHGGLTAPDSVAGVASSVSVEGGRVRC